MKKHLDETVFDNMKNVEEFGATATVPPTMADAVVEKRKTMKQISDAMKDTEAIADEVVKSCSDRDKKVPSNPDRKKLNLDENLFSDRKKSLVEDTVDDDLWTNVYSDLIGFYGDVEIGEGNTLILHSESLSGLEDARKIAAEYEVPVKITIDSNIAKDNPISMTFFLEDEYEEDDVLDKYSESKKSCDCKKVLKEDTFDYSELDEFDEDDDLWTRVYNELTVYPDSPQLRQVPRNRSDFSDRALDPVTGKPSGRLSFGYEKLTTDINGNLQLYSTSVDGLKFAKRVADFYGLDYKVDPNASRFGGNPYYSVMMTIFIPQDLVWDKNTRKTRKA